jgi:hypothetical protein
MVAEYQAAAAKQLEQRSHLDGLKPSPYARFRIDREKVVICEYV